MRKGVATLEHDFEVMRICVHDYLHYIRSIEASLLAMEEDIENQRARIEYGAVRYGRVGGRGALDVNKVPDGVARLMELRDQWLDEYAKHADELARAKALCRPIYENRHTLWLRRVEGLTWATVARRAGVSITTCNRCERLGIQELYELLPEEFRRDAIPNAAPL